MFMLKDDTEFKLAYEEWVADSNGTRKLPNTDKDIKGSQQQQLNDLKIVTRSSICFNVWF